MNRYTSSLDKVSTIITWAVFALGVVIAIICFIALKKSGDRALMLVFCSIGPVLIFVLVIAMYFLMPAAVTINETGLTIERKLSPITINFSEIKTIRAVEKGELSGVIRTFGNGGLFGYTGLYYNKKLGNMTWYCTQRRNFILIEKTNNKKIIVTPDQPEDFLHSVQLVYPSKVTAL